MPIYWLSDDNIGFPDPELASEEGILAVGGDLSPERLLTAYQTGIFPWFNEDSPILWWSPDPRFVLFPEKLKVSRSMRPYLNQPKFGWSLDSHFREVITHCQSAYRPGQGGTWITEEMLEAYVSLHELGFAHSVEVWDQDELVGGLYGISLGRIFFGESMFARVSNASKFGFIRLVQLLADYDFQLIDCQQETRHLASLGAEAIPRKTFLEYLEHNDPATTIRGDWGKLLS